MQLQLPNGNTHRHHFKTGDLLQFIVIRYGDLIRVQRRIVDLIEEWKYGYPRQLRKRIVQLRFVRNLRDDCTAKCGKSGTKKKQTRRSKRQSFDLTRRAP